MRVAARLHLLRALAKRFGWARSGIAAVEFALVFPVILLLYVGAAEVADGVMTSRRVTAVTRTLADLASQQHTFAQATSTPTPQSNALKASDLSIMLSAAATLLTPKSTATLTMTLSAIDVRNASNGVCCDAAVRWTYTQAGTLRPCGQPITGTNSSNVGLTEIPAQLLPYGVPLPQSISVLVAEVSYRYQPLMSASLLNFRPTMQRSEYMMSRTTGQVITEALPSSGTQHGQVCY